MMVLFLGDLLLPCCLDVGVAATAAIMSEVHISVVTRWHVNQWALELLWSVLNGLIQCWWLPQNYDAPSSDTFKNGSG
jgi:hypothetical protein